MTITVLLASLNSCVNPWIYVFFISNIRLSGVTCHCCCSCRPAAAAAAAAASGGGGRSAMSAAADNCRHLNIT